MSAAVSSPVPPRVWMRIAQLSAHLYEDGARVCGTDRDGSPGTRDASPEPAPLTPLGQPYGLICQTCLRILYRSRNPGKLYPAAQEGTVIGDKTVIAVTGYQGHGERVRWRCVCGIEGETYTYNLRRAKATRCVHRVVEVGTSYGNRVVTTLLGGDRARWRCVCGVEGESTLHNLRRTSRECKHVRLVPVDICECGGHLDAHGPRGGACFDDDCDCDERPEGACTAFRGAR